MIYNMPTGIFKRKPHTEETRNKMSVSHKGKHCSDNTKEKMKLAHLGKKYKPMSEIGKKNISKLLKGRKLSDEHKINISKGFIGINTWSKGKKLSEETRKKIGEAQKGEKCHFWKGGITTENHRIRDGIEMSLWREAVFARDNWICQKTKIKGGKLHCHHIKNFSQYPELRFAIDNGITFLEKAHKDFHKIYGIKNNTKEQLIEFLEGEINLNEPPF